jgi:uncharacterized protein YkwD
LSPNRNGRAAVAATYGSLSSLLSRHRGTTRVSLTAISFALIIAFSTETTVIQAGPESVPARPASLLPQNVGIGVPTDHSVTIAFDAAMNPGTVESAFQVLPEQGVELAWNQDMNRITVTPERRWRTDETYVVVVGGSATRTDGQRIPGAQRYAFTTQTAPTVSDFQVRLANSDAAPPRRDQELNAKAEALLDADALEPEVPGSMLPTTTAKSVSATSAITVSFSDEMDTADVESHFAISPAIPGELAWDGGTKLVFTPTERLTPGVRYTISLIGAHDGSGNPLGGKGNFSFIVQPGAQVTKTSPEAEATDAEPPIVEVWFSQPMDVDATNEAFALKDTTTDALVGGHLNWNAERTQLIYAPDSPFAGGRTFEVTFEGGARDADGNAIDTSLSFTTKAAPFGAVAADAGARGTTSTRTAPVIPPAGPATSLAGYALNQVNAARAAYGFGPLVLDAGVSAAASSHAWDQAQNGYFSHTGMNGSSRETRLQAAGVSFSYSGENQCYHMGMSEQATLDWCHAQFMSEPYPGHWNHIGNILDPRATRMGVGIATAGGRTVITWDFTN